MIPTPVKDRVRWSELRPDEFRIRRDACPVVYLPMGLCEPHGHIAALGLDLLKAEHFCDTAARRFGGVVAPSQGYHIHECGFHAPWLAEVVGNENAMMAALPPHVMLHQFLYQLRAFAHAGFRAVIGVSGHAGGSQRDLRRAARLFETTTGLRVVIKADPEWVEGRYQGDHAGKYEISQLLAIRPELVDLSLIERGKEAGAGGRLALGDDALEASAELGREINEAIVAAIGGDVAEIRGGDRGATIIKPDYSATERIWTELKASASDWESVAPHLNQPTIDPASCWKPYERIAHLF